MYSAVIVVVAVFLAIGLFHLIDPSLDVGIRMRVVVVEESWLLKCSSLAAV